jgi:hypothetical protein
LKEKRERGRRIGLGDVAAGAVEGLAEAQPVAALDLDEEVPLAVAERGLEGADDPLAPAALEDDVSVRKRISRARPWA